MPKSFSVVALEGNDLLFFKNAAQQFKAVIAEGGGTYLKDDYYAGNDGTGQVMIIFTFGNERYKFAVGSSPGNKRIILKVEEEKGFWLWKKSVTRYSLVQEIWYTLGNYSNISTTYEGFYSSETISKRLLGSLTSVNPEIKLEGTHHYRGSFLRWTILLQKDVFLPDEGITKDPLSMGEIVTAVLEHNIGEIVIAGETTLTKFLQFLKAGGKAFNSMTENN